MHRRGATLFTLYRWGAYYIYIIYRRCSLLLRYSVYTKTEYTSAISVFVSFPMYIKGNSDQRGD